MNTKSPQEKPTKIELSMEMASALLAQRCREDRKFAAALRAKPRVVLQEMLHQQGLDSISLPDNIVLWENTPEQWHLTVPDEAVARQVVAVSDQPLPDEMLEDIQGGALFTLALGSLLSVSLLSAGSAALSVYLTGTAGAVATASAVSATTIIGGAVLATAGAAVATAVVAGAGLGVLAATDAI